MIWPVNIWNQSTYLKKNFYESWFIKSTKRNLQYEDKHVSEIEGFGLYYAYETFI